MEVFVHVFFVYLLLCSMVNAQVFEPCDICGEGLKVVADSNVLLPFGPVFAIDNCVAFVQACVNSEIDTGTCFEFSTCPEFTDVCCQAGEDEPSTPQPTTEAPSPNPTTQGPSREPTDFPSPSPSASPSKAPTPAPQTVLIPIVEPSASPSDEPTVSLEPSISYAPTTIAGSPAWSFPGKTAFVEVLNRGRLSWNNFDPAMKS